jgi:transcriptional regulator with XRE-family HTH domain
MSMQTISTEVPEFDEADRLRKALRVADVPVQDMAEYLGVSRNTVSRWINGTVEPKAGILRAWSQRTGVDYQWLAGEPPIKSKGASKRRVKGTAH